MTPTTKLKKKLLIVDDNPGIRETIRLAVEEQDYLDIDFTECSDVDSGIEQLHKIRPDIVILDLHMPNKSGFDFLDIMNTDEHLAKTKVIMMSADDSLPNIFKAGDKGINAYYFLGKPFDVSDLQALVLEICLPLKT